MDFKELLAAANEAADELKKSQVDDGDQDEKIHAAAGEDDNDAGDADAGADEGQDGEETLGKSFKFTLEDGTEIEAQDGTELVKSLFTRVEESEGAIQQALGATFDLVKSQGAVIKSQGEMIKNLQAQIGKVSTAGRGRKAILSVNERQDPTALRKSQADEPKGLKAEEFMAKALDLQASGKLTGLDVARIEASLNEGVPVADDLVRRVMA